MNETPRVLKGVYLKGFVLPLTILAFLLLSTVSVPANELQKTTVEPKQEEAFTKKDILDVVNLTERHVLNLPTYSLVIRELGRQKIGIGIRVYQTRLKGREKDTVIVTKVDTTSAKQILQRGDHIIAVNGTPLLNVEQLVEISTSSDLDLIDTTITLTIDRSDQIQTITVPRVLLWKPWLGTPEHKRLQEKFKLYEKHARASARKARSIVAAMDDKETILLSDPWIVALNESFDMMLEARDSMLNLINSMQKP